MSSSVTREITYLEEFAGLQQSLRPCVCVFWALAEQQSPLSSIDWPIGDSFTKSPQWSKHNRTSPPLIASPLKKREVLASKKKTRRAINGVLTANPCPRHTRPVSPPLPNLITPCSEPVIKAESSPPHPHLLCNSTCIIAAPNLFSTASAGSQPASPIGRQVLIESHFMPASDKTKVGFHRASLILLLRLLRRYRCTVNSESCVCMCVCHTHTHSRATSWRADNRQLFHKSFTVKTKYDAYGLLAGQHCLSDLNKSLLKNTGIRFD